MYTMQYVRVSFGLPPDVLQYHLTQSTMYSAGLRNGKILTTAQGNNVTISMIDGKTASNKA